MRRLGIVAASIVMLLMTAGCGLVGGGAKPTPTPETFSLTGALTLSHSDPKSYMWDPGKPCSGSDGFSDLSGGRDVVVKDNQGTVIAKGTLQSGVGVGQGYSTVCKFSFTVDGIPRFDFYVVDMGRRGQFTYSFDEIQSQGWNVAYTIGD